MSEETTERLNDGDSFETRPIWEAVLERLDKIDAKFEVVARTMLEVRAEINLLKKRLPPAA